MLHDIIYTVADYSKSALKSSCTVGMMCWSDTGQSSREQIITGLPVLINIYSTVNFQSF